METDLIKHFFPIELLDHFEYRSSQIKMGEHGEYLEVEFEEKSELPQGYSREDYESKDFLVRRVQDFPIRSHAVFLKLRRRRWRHKETGETISRDLSFIAEGSRFTKEVAAFLKDIRRDEVEPTSVVAHYMGVNEDTLRRHYKKNWSGFHQWQQLMHAEKYLLYPQNITAHMAIDEVSLSQGELYTILSSRDRPGRKGKIAAVIRGTKAEDLITVLSKLPESLRE